MSKVGFISLTIFLLVILAAVTFMDRPLIIGLFMVDSHITTSPNLLVILEGGGLLHSPTRERMNKLIEIYKREPTKILVCSYPKYKDELLTALYLNGVRPSDIVKNKYVYDKRGGTYNNVSEIMDTLKKNKKFKVIDIITSPYHEKRVQLIFLKLFHEYEINKLVQISFSHIEYSDVYYTNNERYFDLIGHEILGIAWFEIQMLQVKIEGLKESVYARLYNQ